MEFSLQTATQERANSRPKAEPQTFLHRESVVTRGKILIVQDDANFRFRVREFLQVQGYEVYEAESCLAALGVFRSFGPDVVVSDFSLSDGNALELLPRLRNVDPELRFLVMTRHGTIDLAVKMIKAGADQFLTKPIELPSFLTVLQQILEQRRNHKNRLASQAQRKSLLLDPFLGVSPAVRALAQKAKKLLSTDHPILIQGETGTGKGVLAAWLHFHGPRRNGSFVDLNCASLSQELLESDLFGHERGAFTGAVAAKRGLFEVAHGGTVFLDEIGDMDLQVQPKLLKALEEKRFRRLGDVCERLVDARLIAATHKDLSRLAREGKFRIDLYFRINIFPIRLPPLRERIEDIPILARRMLREIVSDLGRDDLVLSPDFEEALRSYQWPGNIRELRQTLERAVLFCEDNTMAPKDLHIEHLSDGASISADQILPLSELERRHIEKALWIERGRVEEAAKKLRLSRSALYQKIKKHRIDLSKIHKVNPEFGTNCPLLLDDRGTTTSANNISIIS
jgi:DNA-binding NtrC family response regulator